MLENVIKQTPLELAQLFADPYSDDRMFHDAGAEFVRRDAHQSGVFLGFDREFRDLHAEQSGQAEVTAWPLVIEEILTAVELDVSYQNQEETLRTNITSSKLFTFS